MVTGEVAPQARKPQAQEAVPLTKTDTAFDHSTPAVYDRYMGPLLFEPYAKVVAVQ